MIPFFRELLKRAAMLATFGSAVVLSTEASAGCKLVIKGFNYQAVECDRYTPVVSDLANFTELVKRQVKNPGCFQKLADIVATEYACGIQVYALGAAIVGAYGEIAAAGSIAGVITAAGDNQYIIVGDNDGNDSLLDQTSSQCKQIEPKVAAWAENDVCIKSGRPKLPASFTNPKPSKIVREGNTKYIQPLDGSARTIYDGRKYNRKTDKCDVYVQGKLQTSTYFLLCDEWKTGELFHWNGINCERIVNGNALLDRVEPYRCGTQYDAREIFTKVSADVCVKTANRAFVAVVDNSVCSGLQKPLEDAYIWSNGQCALYRNGQLSSYVGKNYCGRNEAYSYEFTENDAGVGQCRHRKTNGLYDLVPNSYCQRPSRYVVKSLSSCVVSVDGVYQKLLFNGQEDCFIDSAPNSLPPANSGNDSGYPYCQSAGADQDGDGWGYENNSSCKVLPGTSVPLPPLTQPGSDAASPPPAFVCQSASSDDDGDGWGWENGASCQVVAPVQSGSSSISVDAPTSISAYGSFSVTITSYLNRSVTAEIWLKEDGGNYSPHAEQQFTLNPGQNYQTATIHTFPDASKNYRIEVRFLENFESKEMFGRRVSIRY